MNLDIQTLVLVSTVLYLASLCMMLLLHLNRLTASRTTWCWVLSNFFIWLGMIFQVFRPKMPLLLSVIAGNLLLFMGAMILWQGLRMFLERKPLSKYVVLSPLLLTIPYYWFTEVSHSISIRIALFYIVLAIVLSAIGRDLLLSNKKRPGLAKKLLGLGFIIYGLFFLSNLALVSFVDASATFFQSGLASQLSLLVGCVFVVFYNAGMAMLVGERLRHDLLDAQQQTLRANKALSRFIKNMGHELRTPVDAILGMVDLSLQEPLEGEQRENILVARHAAKQLMEMVEDLRDISRIESGKFFLEKRDFDLNRLLRTIKAGLNSKAQAKDTVLEMSAVPEDLRYLKGDPARVRQILANVLSCAVSLTSEGGISLLVLPHKPLAATAEKARDLKNIRILIQISGAGFPEETPENFSEEFAKNDQHQDVGLGGMGLGVVLGRKLARLMDGDVFFEQNLLTGSTFHVNFALSPGDPAMLREDEMLAPLHTPQRKNRLNILLVEDNEANAFVVRRIVNRMGHKLLVAKNGLDALQLLRINDCDLVFMDLEMPFMDGLETTRRIRSGEAGKGHSLLPIVALTAHALDEFKDKAREAGMDDFLTKPVDLEQLQALIARSDLGKWRDHASRQERIMDFEAQQLLESEPRQEEVRTRSIDQKALLRRLDGDEELMWQLWRLFENNSPNLLRQMEQELQTWDFDALRTSAHTLKGEAANVGAEDCREVARILEEAAKNQEPEEARELLRTLKEHVTRVLADIETLSATRNDRGEAPG